MNAREAVLLSPYRPPTSYPVSLNSEEVEAWLRGYFALWHPALLRVVNRPPNAASTYDHDVPRAGFLYAIPTGPTLYQPENWGEQVAENTGASFQTFADAKRTEDSLRVALTEWESRNPTEPIPQTLRDAPAEIVRQFEAIGFGHLLVETLFDAASHDHLLDHEGFWNDVKAAVAALANSNPGEVRVQLKLASEKLATARQVLNSNSLRIVEFDIRNAANLNAEWPASLANGLPLTVIASGQLLQTLANEHPARFRELKSKFHPDLPNAVDLAIGADTERDDDYLPPESQWWNLRQARETTRRLFDVSPTIYARSRSAFHPHLPGWLLHAGFTHAVLFSLDGAKAPGRNASVVNWASPDGKTLNAFAREPHSAGDPQTFFNLAHTINQAFGSDSSPTLALKHTGDPAAPGYAQLVALADLGDALGEWVGLGRFLAESHYGEYLGTTTADDYFQDALDDRVLNRHTPDAASGFASHLRTRRTLDSAFALASLHRVLTPPTDVDEIAVRELSELEDRFERGESVADEIEKVESKFAFHLAARIQQRSPANQPGYLILNPCNFARRVALELPDFGGGVAVADPIKAADFDGKAAKLVVEVPSLGFAWIPKGNPNLVAPKPRIKTAEGNGVRNELLEAEFDPNTGAIRAIRDLRTRINRLGMQLTFQPGSTTKARSITVTNSGAALGEVVCEGDILDEHNNVHCRFKQRLRAWIGRPVLELKIELDPVHRPNGYAWHAYYGARFAARDPRVSIFRGSQGANDRSTSNRPVSPDYLEFRLGAERTCLFTGGLPFLQKHGDRMVDLVLIPEGEECRTFEMLIAFDRDYPMQTASGWTTSAPVIRTDKGPPPNGTSGWLAHVDLPSVLMTSMRPVPAGEGMNRAVALRLMETAGFAGATDMRFARDPNRAFNLDGDGVPGAEIALNEGAIPTDFSANETFRVRAEWS